MQKRKTASQITIYAGSSTHFVGSQTRVGSQVIVHLSYSAMIDLNDIAPLRLASPFSISYVFLIMFIIRV